MHFYDRLLNETSEERGRFLSVPIIGHAADHGVSLEVYLAFLTEAYHHVKFTCPLLQMALSHCPTDDDAYRAGLLDYIDEETGHEQWILDDIQALGGDETAVRRGEPRVPCRAMVGYAIYAIEHVSPYAMLGMVHVLEGVSAQIASRAAQAIARSLGQKSNAGFSYLASHGALDLDHVQFFIELVNRIDNRAVQDAIIDTANVIYRLYGEIFRDLGRREEAAYAA